MDADLQKELERLRQRAERERAARLEAESVAEAGTRQIYERQRQLELLQVVTDSANSADAPEACLQVALEEWCRFTSWPVGHVFFIAPEAPLRLISSKIWNIDQPQAFAQFREVTERTVLQPNEGLPGRALSQNRSVWISDLAADGNFPRAKALPNLGLQSGFAFPVRIGAEVVAVFEFFSTDLQEPNESWLTLATNVGTQVGRVFERARAHSALVDVNNRLQQEVLERQRAEAELRSIQPRLIEASREAGRAEVATGVLHNVGNVLNSVNISVTEVREHLEKSRLPLLGKSVALLQQNQNQIGDFFALDPKGKALPGFLERLSDTLTRENQWFRSEMIAVGRHLEHIKNIVNMQQNYARVSGITETIEPRAIVEDALELSAQSLETYNIHVERQFGVAEEITADRHKTLQILINLIRNAIQAIHEADPPARVLDVRIFEKSADQIAIAVTDTGVGISPENLPKIFRHGFTTKQYGHGFGLHSCVLAAREMKGDLLVHSDGPGRGARFTLELPKHLLS